jgi:hypothetical protein
MIVCSQAIYRDQGGWLAFTNRDDLERWLVARETPIQMRQEPRRDVSSVNPRPSTTRLTIAQGAIQSILCGVVRNDP